MPDDEYRRYFKCNFQQVRDSDGSFQGWKATIRRALAVLFTGPRKTKVQTIVSGATSALHSVQEEGPCEMAEHFKQDTHDQALQQNGGDRLVNNPIERECEWQRAVQSKDYSVWARKCRQHFQDCVVGQEEPVDRMLAAILAYKSGLTVLDDLPSGPYLFLGPTDLGQAELAKAVAGELFGDESRVVQMFNMSSGTAERLIMAPPDDDGSIGRDTYHYHRQFGNLTEAVRQRPGTVVVFYGIEKADPSVLNLLYKIWDNGAATDSQGRRVSFKDTFIILTSDLDAKNRLDGSSAETGDQRMYEERLRKQAEDDLPKDLLRRIATSNIVVFFPFSQCYIRKMARRFLDDVSTNLRARGVKLTVTDAAIDLVFEPKYSSTILDLLPLWQWP